MLSENEKQLLKALNAAGVEYMIVGLSAAVLQQSPLVTKDVDLWFKELDEPTMDRCSRAVGGFFLPTDLRFQTPARFGGETLENLDIVMSVSGIGSFEEEYKNAIDVKLADDLVVKVLPLEKIIASKKFVGRDKDLAALPALKSTLAAQQKK